MPDQPACKAPKSRSLSHLAAEVYAVRLHHMNVVIMKLWTYVGCDIESLDDCVSAGQTDTDRGHNH